MRFRRTGVLLALFLASATSLLAQALEPKQVEVYGAKISYLEAGSGPSVILLHGMGANKNHWRSTIPVLAAKFHVYAPDQIGFGTSDKPMINYRVDARRFPGRVHEQARDLEGDAGGQLDGRLGRRGLCDQASRGSGSARARRCGRLRHWRCEERKARVPEPRDAR